MLRQGDVILLVSPEGKPFLRRYDEGATLHTHEGVLRLADVGQAGYGGSVRTHKGHVYRVLRPNTCELIKGVRRATTIMYPKEIGYILLKLGIGPGTRVVESGSGSGGLSVALAWHVGREGRLYTFERRREFYDLAGENLDALGFLDRVTRYHHDIIEGFSPPDMIPGDPVSDPADADALFLDVRTPWDYLEQAAAVVCPGGPVGFLLPTTNQVSDLLRGLEVSPFEDVEVMEILVRRYKPVADRLRPEDRMVAHTGFLVFARRRGRPPAEMPAVEQALPETGATCGPAADEDPFASAANAPRAEDATDTARPTGTDPDPATSGEPLLARDEKGLA